MLPFKQACGHSAAPIVKQSFASCVRIDERRCASFLAWEETDEQCQGSHVRSIKCERGAAILNSLSL